MERIVKIFLLLIIAMNLTTVVFAETSAPVQSNKVELSQCIKTFPISYDKLYYLTLAGLNEHDYQIKEIQTRGGYIVFETGNRKYLASIVYVSSAKSMLKITPYSGNYDFPVSIPQNLFTYIQIYENTKF